MPENLSKFITKVLFNNYVDIKLGLNKDTFMSMLNRYNKLNGLNRLNYLVDIADSGYLKEMGLNVDLESLKRDFGEKLIQTNYNMLCNVKLLFSESFAKQLTTKYKESEFSVALLSYDETAEILRRNNLPVEILDHLEDCFKYDSKYQAKIKQDENQKKADEVLTRARSKVGYVPNFSLQGKKHDQLVDLLARESDYIETGLELIDVEYKIDDGWARTDIRYKDKNGKYLVVEVKQEAENNQEGFDNAKKAVTQTAGYQRAVEAQLIYEGIQNPQVRGMLVAYIISQEAKNALEIMGLEYTELLPELREIKNEIKEGGLEIILV